MHVACETWYDPCMRLSLSWLFLYLTEQEGLPNVADLVEMMNRYSEGIAGYNHLTCGDCSVRVNICELLFPSMVVTRGKAVVSIAERPDAVRL